MSDKLTGVVKRWIDDRGYGFIRGDDDLDYFIHVRAVPGFRHRTAERGRSSRLLFLKKDRKASAPPASRSC